MTTFEYGAMSSRYSLQAEHKLTAYATMCIHYRHNAHMVALYEPQEIVKDDSWLNPMGKISDRLDEIFGGVDSFDEYVNNHRDEIKAAYKTIKQLC